MNIAEIETAVSDLAAKPFDCDTFFYDLIDAYGAPASTVARIRSGSSGKTDVEGALLWAPKIHYAHSAVGEVPDLLDELAKGKAVGSKAARFLVATDGEDLGIRDTKLDETLYFPISELGERFGCLLPAAGFERYSAIEKNPVDVKASSRLAKFYDAIIKENPDWEDEDRRDAMCRFMARMVFCLFADSIGVFEGNAFAKTLVDYGGRDGSDAPALIERIFISLGTSSGAREELGYPIYLAQIPYVGGDLFSGGIECPSISKTAWRHLRGAMDLDWAGINPDIFGSMLQAVVKPNERDDLGMHYTSVPNIMKVLGPLFLDGYKARYEAAGHNVELLRTLLVEVRRTRVFDPACGSGNFLVVAYKELRSLAEMIEGRLRTISGRPLPPGRIPISNFYGIEIDDFAAETARIALWIAELQADKHQADSLDQQIRSLPLGSGANISCGNSLRLDWSQVCPRQDGYHTYVAGNPPFLGYGQQSPEQKEDMKDVFDGHLKSPKLLDFVSCWFFKGSQFLKSGLCSGVAFVSTNSICQGDSVPTLWPHILDGSVRISFAHRSFKWSNNASQGSVVTCVVVGLEAESDEDVSNKPVIGPYLTSSLSIVTPSRTPAECLPSMLLGNVPKDGGNLFLTSEEREDLLYYHPEAGRFIKKFVGSQELIKGIQKYCLWIPDEEVELASSIPMISRRIEAVRAMRLASKKEATQNLSERAHRFGEIRCAPFHSSIVVPRVSSERRYWIPIGRLGADYIIGDRNFALYDAPVWNLAILSSRLHRVWIGTVCGRMKTDLSYSNTLGWNTFPIPKLTIAEKHDLSACARAILIARDTHPTRSLSELYDPDKMPDNLRTAHTWNDLVIEKIYVGRVFNSDLERLDHLFERYEEVKFIAPQTD